MEFKLSSFHVEAINTENKSNKYINLIDFIQASSAKNWQTRILSSNIIYKTQTKGAVILVSEFPSCRIDMEYYVDLEFSKAVTKYSKLPAERDAYFWLAPYDEGCVASFNVVTPNVVVVSSITKGSIGPKVVATKGPVRSLQEEIFHLPFSNVYADGHLCLSYESKAGLRDLANACENTYAGIDKFIFDSLFRCTGNNDLTMDGRVTFTPDKWDIVGGRTGYKALDSLNLSVLHYLSTVDTFDNSILKPFVPSTLEELINKIIITLDP